MSAQQNFTGSIFAFIPRSCKIAKSGKIHKSQNPQHLCRGNIAAVDFRYENKALRRGALTLVSHSGTVRRPTMRVNRSCWRTQCTRQNMLADCRRVKYQLKQKYFHHNRIAERVHRPWSVTYECLQPNDRIFSLSHLKMHESSDGNRSSVDLLGCDWLEMSSSAPSRLLIGRLCEGKSVGVDSKITMHSTLR